MRHWNLIYYYDLQAIQSNYRDRWIPKNFEFDFDFISKSNH